MKRLCDIAISAVFLLVLFGPIAVFACECSSIELPSWLTAEDARYLSGGFSDGNTKANLTPSGFMSKSLQPEIENEIGNRVPFKAFAILGNAALQRGAISIANSPFNWECYPTFFDSERLYIPSENALTYKPGNLDKDKMLNMQTLGENLASFAKRYPEKRFVIVVVPGYQEPAVNPAYSLVSDCATPQDYFNALCNGTGNQENVFPIMPQYTSLTSYYEDYFKTDHHWNHRGSEKAFNEIANTIGLPPFHSSGEEIVDNYLYSGATARSALDLVTEEVYVEKHAFSDLTIITPDGNSFPYNHDRFFNRTDPGKRFGFHDSYYDFLPNKSRILGHGQRRALLVSNSYGASIGPYIYNCYQESTLMYSIHPANRDSAARLNSILEETSADDVFLVAQPSDLASFAQKCPDFFS